MWKFYFFAEFSNMIVEMLTYKRILRSSIHIDKGFTLQV